MNPVFLIGAERSGTTLLRLMLDGHPCITWLNEFEYSVDRISELDRWPGMKEYVAYLSTNRIFQATGFKIDETLEYPELIISFLRQKQQRDNKDIIGATCHRHYDRLLRLFPQSRLIYLFRDPRDVARSNIGMGWAGNVWTGVNQWIEAENLWKRVRQQLDRTSYIEIRSEELVASPEETLTTICRFLDIDYDDKMMAYPEYTTYSKPDPSLTEQWKRKMNPSEIGLVESKAFDIMKERGYHPKFDVPQKISLLRKVFLLVQDKFFRICFNVKRFGFWLIVAYFLARKLKLQSIEKKLKIQLNEKTKKFLK